MVLWGPLNPDVVMLYGCFGVLYLETLSWQLFPHWESNFTQPRCDASAVGTPRFNLNLKFDVTVTDLHPAERQAISISGVVPLPQWVLLWHKTDHSLLRQRKGTCKRTHSNHHIPSKQND